MLQSANQFMKRGCTMILSQYANGKTRVMGLLGSPVSQTKSPLIHNTLCTEYGINAIYLPFEVKQENLGTAVAGLRALDCLGFNVTVPYKQEIIKYLDKVDAEALEMGAVNTVKNDGGCLIGYNTDADGFLKDLSDNLTSEIRGKRIMVLGAGGTSRAICLKLSKSGISHLAIANRTNQKAGQIAALVEQYAPTSTVSPTDTLFLELLHSSDIIINTTPVGMSTTGGGMPFDYPFVLSPNQMIYDVIYNPEFTQLLYTAQNAGCKVCNGLGMLINQAVLAFEIWTEKKVENSFSQKLIKVIRELEDL